MIISDKYEFVFVHIPKCAGTTLRKYLKEFDDTKGKFEKSTYIHPILGTIDSAHIPLKILKEYFPKEYNKIETYWSFGIVREPFNRFKSSLAQRMRMYKRKEIYQMSIKEIQKEIDEAISFLSNYGEFYLPHSYIHFQRQVDYIFFKNKQIIKDIYDIKNVEKLIKKLENLLKKPYIIEKHNQTKFYKNDIYRVTVESLKKIASPIKRYIPKNLKEHIHSMLLTNNNQKIDKLFNSKYIKDFVNEYYKEDIKLYYSKKIIR